MCSVIPQAKVAPSAIYSARCWEHEDEAKVFGLKDLESRGDSGAQAAA